MPTLFEIEQEYRRIEQHILDNDGEVTAEIETDLDINEIELEEKADAYAAVISESAGRVAAIDAEIKRLQKRKSVEQSLQDRLRGRLADAVNLFGAFKTSTHNYSNRTTRSVVVFDPEQLDKQYVTTKTVEQPDKAAIKAAFDAGSDVRGATIVEKTSIQIR